jgi:hypothetical protein
MKQSCYIDQAITTENRKICDPRLALQQTWFSKQGINQIQSLNPKD